MDNLYFWANSFWPYVMATMILMVLLRFALFVISLFRDIPGSGSASDAQLESVSLLMALLNFLRSFVPGYQYLKVKPFYVLHRIFFHVCLFVCIFFLSFHVYAWEDTLPQWVLYLLPSYVLSDKLVEYTALFVIFSVIYMFLKRWILKDLRQSSGPFDFMLPFVILIPFVTGYYAMTGQQTAMAFIDYNLDTIHVLSGDLFILVAGFLFCKTIIIKKRCIACLACVNNCPTRALVTKDVENMRHIHYTAENCIHCGTCVAVCEDRASGLRHSLGIPWPGRQKELCTSEMSACKICNTLFATKKQLDKIQQKNIDCDLGICPECRQFSHARTQQKLLL
jgi:ferredoxin